MTTGNSVLLCVLMFIVFFSTYRLGYLHGASDELDKVDEMLDEIMEEMQHEN